MKVKWSKIMIFSPNYFSLFKMLYLSHSPSLYWELSVSEGQCGDILYTFFYSKNYENYENPVIIKMDGYRWNFKWWRHRIEQWMKESITDIFLWKTKKDKNTQFTKGDWYIYVGQRARHQEDEWHNCWCMNKLE